ncbi:hypothetical protein OROHE_027377 [Orobanche hederae]
MRLVPLAAFGWVMATHLSLYHVILIIPMILLLGYGPYAPRILFLLRRNGKGEDYSSRVLSKAELPNIFCWRPVWNFLLWTIMWSAYVLFLCAVSVRKHGGLWEMFESNVWFHPHCSRFVSKYWCFLVFLCRGLRFLQKLLPDCFPYEYSIYDPSVGLTAEAPSLLSCFCIHRHVINV